MRTIRLGDIPTIKQGNKTFSLSELIGKPIIANEQTIAYKFPSENSIVYFLPSDVKLKDSEVVAIDDINVYENNTDFATEKLLYKAKKGEILGTYEFDTTSFPRYYLQSKKASPNTNGRVFIKKSDEKDSNGYRKDVFIVKGMIEKDNVYYTFNKNKTIGTLFTWVSGKTMIKLSKGAYYYKNNPEIFMSFKEGEKNYYVPLKPKTIDVDALEQSGAKDEETKQEEKEENEKSIFEKGLEGILGGLKKVVIIGGIGFLVFKIGTFAISESLKNRNNGNQKK